MKWRKSGHERGLRLALTPSPTGLLRSGLASLSVGFVLLAAIIAATIWFVHEEQASSADVRHAVGVEMQIDRLEVLMLNAETGQRGFLLTGEEPYLAPYDQTVGGIDRTFERLGTTVANNSEQTQALNTLRRIAREKLAELNATITARRAGRLDEALAIVRTGSGKAFMDEARATIEHMIDVEHRLVAASQQRAAQAAVYLQASVFAAGLLLAALAACTLLFFQRQMRSAIDARDALHAANDRLVKEIVQRERVEDQLRQSQKMEALGQLTGGLAHDFNNMLAIILGSLDLLKRRYARGETNLTRHIVTAMEGADRAAALTQRLLAFSRRQPLAPKPIDANRFVPGISDLLRRTLGANVQLETVLAGGLWLTHADASQLEITLINLAINARDAMSEGGRLTIETANTYLDEAYAALHAEVSAGQYVMIAVSDTGIGMPPDVIAKAFDPFFTTKDVGKGTGLGLSQVFGFVKQSHGHVKIYSEPGHGATVKLYLPRFFGTYETPAEALPAAADLRLPTGSPREVILAVDDEEGVREFTVESLQELGYTVLHADSAASALRILDSQPDVTLLFTDIVMPDVNGRRLADEARRRRPELKVLYTTGYTRNAVVHNGVLDADVHLVTKPFTLGQLALKVREALET